MKISTEIMSAAHHVGEERAIEYLAKTGFDVRIFLCSICVNTTWKHKAF